MEHFIDINEVSYLYQGGGQNPLLAVDDVSIAIEQGSHVAILGRNGSGKSTLARLINALELPSKGTVIVSGMLTSDDDQVWNIRSRCGMVFQNPDNQIVGTTVEEDVAFGPENLGYPQPKIREAVDESLQFVGLEAYAEHAPHLLSGGQKQKLAIAGILAMKPSCLILDEATSMLDPNSRRDFMALVNRLICEEGMTVINITHNMEEVLAADMVYLMSEGRIVSSGTPGQIFDQVALVKSLGLDVPTHTDIAHQIADLTQQQLKPLEAVEAKTAGAAIVRMLDNAGPEVLSNAVAQVKAAAEANARPQPQTEAVITVENLDYTYSIGTAMARKALEDVSFTVYRGELLGVMGQSGSGKSTLIQHLNGLLRTQSGSVNVIGLDASSNEDIPKIRQKLGLLFQYPEHQLFEETVFQDIAFGPRRMGLEMTEIEQRVLAAARIVGLTDEELDRSPFELSGGQKRRAAIAGVLAMKPQILVLDEPAAGLDPAGRDEILGYANHLRVMGVTVILVSHSMEDIARLCDRVLVLNNGRVHTIGTPSEVFADESELNEAGLPLPMSASFLKELADRIPGLQLSSFTSDDAAAALIRAAAAQKGV
ncbi:MAG: energy-coupling factor transporter ATPase [Saccharofermentanales bacterium]|jgi:energy-coupling factor transporter ATPase